MRAPKALRLLKLAYSGWQNDHIARRGAALAYYTLFALGPVLLIAVAVAGTIFGESAARGEIVSQIEDLVGPSGAQVVQTVLANAGPGRGNIMATIAGFAGFLLAATGAFLELQAALNRIWRVKPKKHKGGFVGDVKRFALKRARSFGLVISIGFLLVVSLALSAAINAAGGWITGRVPAGTSLVTLANYALSLLFIMLLFAAIYRILPDAKLGWSDVLLGAGITALLFTLGKELIGLYLGRSAAASTYGAAGSVVLLLAWVYYSAQISLFGAEFSRVYLRARRRRVQPTADAERDGWTAGKDRES